MMSTKDSIKVSPTGDTMILDEGLVFGIAKMFGHDTILERVRIDALAANSDRMVVAREQGKKVPIYAYRYCTLPSDSGWMLVVFTTEESFKAQFEDLAVGMDTVQGA